MSYQSELRAAGQPTIEYSCEITEDGVRVTAAHLRTGKSTWMEACLPADEVDSDILVELATDARLDLIDLLTDSCRWCDDGEPCRKPISDCPRMRQSALEAGIPASVIDGKTKLSNHFSREHIEREAGKLVTCETCGGSGFGKGPYAVVSDMQCPTCDGAGEVAR